MSIRNYHWALFANMSLAAVSWLMLLVIIRLGEKDDVGVYSLAQALVLPVHMFFTLKLRSVQCADHGNEIAAGVYHKLRQLSAVFNLIISALLLIIVGPGDEVFWCAMILSLSYTLVITRETSVSIFQKTENNNLLFLMNASVGAISLVTFSLAFLITKNLLTSLLVYVATKIILYFSLEASIFSKLGVVIERVSLRKSEIRNSVVVLLRRSFPLGVAALLGALFTSIPKAVIADTLGMEPLAVYTAITSLLVAFNLLVNSFVQSALPGFAKNYANDFPLFVRKLIKACLRIVVLGVLAMMFAWVFGANVLDALFGADYAEHTVELMAVLLSGMALSLLSIGSLMLTAQKSFFSQLPIYALCCLIIWSTSAWAVGTYGINGVILAQAFSFLMAFAVSWLVFRFNRSRVAGECIATI